MHDYFQLLSFLKEHRKIFSFAVGAMFFASLFEGVQLSLLVPLTDRIFNKRSIVLPDQVPEPLVKLAAYLNAIEPQTLLMVLPIFVFVLMIFKHVLSFGYQVLMNEVSQRVLRDVRQKLYAKIESLSLDYFSEKRTGELIARITHDVHVIESAVSYGVTDLFRQTFMIVFYIAVAMSIHWKAAFIIFLAGPMLGWPITRIGKKLKKLARSSQERMADISSILIETISGIKVVKAFCTENEEVERFRVKNHDFYKLKMKSVKRALLIDPITEIFGVICGIILIFWIGTEVMNGELSFGIFVLFFGSIMSIISPLKKLGNVNAMTQQALAANKRIYAILNEEPSVKEKVPVRDIPTIRENIILDHVYFRYEKEGDFVLHDINLEIRVGELVAIVGPTGTGKTTLVNLIPRFYDPIRGSVRIDGTDLKDVSFRSLRYQLGIVSQETFLFNDTVRANIAYGRKDASQSEIEEAARQAYAHQFIVDMPQGYDTVIGDMGFRLSGGEKQRMSIARAIMKNPAILILDEATSQLDSESEKYVQEALDTLMQGRTVVAIAHRLSTIMKADKIVVLDKGRMVGQGKHQELLEDCPLYRRLYETQFQI